MNTNLAETAVDKLTAQIGEALFGQPGLNLMELAQMVKGMHLESRHFDVEAMLAACVPGGDIADPQSIADNIREWFPAQSTPVGQWDAHSLWAMAQLSSGEGIEDGVKRIESALAARQPVGDATSVAVIVGELTSFVAHIAACASNRDGTVTIPASVKKFAGQLTERCDSMKLVFNAVQADAPPAQAVDLGKFTDEDVKAWVERNDLGGSFGSLTDARCAFDDARSAHLIDSQAVKS